MYPKKKERLYITDLIEEPAMPYPAYYLLSQAMHRNEMLQSALIALHSYDFSHYTTPQSFEKIFATLQSGSFAIFKEYYIVGYFGGKMMYLEPSGWRSLPATEALFRLENWLVA